VCESPRLERDDGEGRKGGKREEGREEEEEGECWRDLAKERD